MVLYSSPRLSLHHLMILLYVLYVCTLSNVMLRVHQYYSGELHNNCHNYSHTYRHTKTQMNTSWEFPTVDHGNKIGCDIYYWTVSNNCCPIGHALFSLDSIFPYHLCFGYYVGLGYSNVHCVLYTINLLFIWYTNNIWHKFCHNDIVLVVLHLYI